MAHPRNKGVFSRFVEALHHDYGGKEQCPWSRTQLLGSCETYYKSLSDAQRRSISSKTDEHRTACRRQGRMRDKLEHRISALDKASWSENTKEEVRQVLNLEYTSSDESCHEENSDTEEPQLTCYQVKHLKWERTRLTKMKKVLDSIYHKSLLARVRRSLVPRVLDTLESNRDTPENVVEWAVRRTVPVERLGVSISNSSSTSSPPAHAVPSNNLSGRFHSSPMFSSTPCGTKRV